MWLSDLASAAVKTPLDMDIIKLALQGYNYGDGYIPWAINHYGGYTLVNEAEFTDMMVKKKGWRSYGDTYWSWYGFGSRVSWYGE